jgi:hypothetical protein
MFVIGFSAPFLTGRTSAAITWCATLLVDAVLLLPAVLVYFDYGCNMIFELWL